MAKKTSKKSAPRPAKASPRSGPSRSPRAAANGDRTPIESVTHRDKRVNIPTEELRDFVKEDDQKQVVLYPRNPDLDPQLVWRGKDDQDRTDLAVPAVPVYIQEKIHPQSIIDDFRRTAAAPTSAGSLDQGPMLFDAAAFNGLPEDFASRVDFYQHQGHWSNRLILGDSLLVMTSLAEKEGLKGRVQCVYFDPPYGIKFGSNWQVSTRKRDVKDGKAEDVVRQPEQMRAFRDTWELGIHSYLSYLRDRLTAARELLTQSGSIFVQIGDENVHLVRSVMDEVFGSENFVALIPFAKTSGSTREFIGGTCDYLLFYGKDRERLKFRPVFNEKSVASEAGGPYGLIQLPDGSRRRMTAEEIADISRLPSGARVFRLDNLQSQSMGRDKGEGASCWFPVAFKGKEWLPSEKSRWKTNEEGMAALHAAGRLESTGTGLYYVRYIDDFPAMPIGDVWSDTVVAGFASDKKYVVETSTKVVERCLLMTTDPGDLVLDPTCGSGTTAFVAEQWGRRWITTDTSRVALTLARTRLMAARFPYYIPADSPEGRKLELELSATNPERERAGSVTVGPSDYVGVPGESGPDIRRGFIYKRVPHVTLKSIANNPDIKEGMSRREIDAAIARHADTELLYDKPERDDKRLRVCGPFTVESLSPHRTVSFKQRQALSTTGHEGVTLKVHGPDEFGRLVLDNLRRAGVQNTYKGEKMVFDTLDPHPGEWIQGAGVYTDKSGKSVKVAVCIGPEHGTVGPELVKEAAKEAVKGVGFDTLLVAGFAFDPHVGEEAKRYGNLTVLPVRINADIAMGDLLKKTGAANLFMIFGEPDITVRPAKKDELHDDRLKASDHVVVEIHGLDVYDPTTGDVRSSSTDDIACWFIDTDYNGESFFVRHAYFTGAGSEKGQGPYDKLKRALRAEVDEAAWAALYSTVSRPFPKPASKRIAVKVINHYGDEVLQVYFVK